jgi:hypothetical protein
MMRPRGEVGETRENRVVVVDDKLTGSSVSCENKLRFHVLAQLILHCKESSAVQLAEKLKNIFVFFFSL